MILIATYDVRNDGRRARLAALLQTWGDRVQFSVFVITVSEDELTDLRVRAAGIIDPQHDSFYVFRQCATCWDGLSCVGQASQPEESLYWAAL